MSETTTTTVSAPTPTAEVAANVIDAFEQTTATGTDLGDAVTEPAATDATPPPAQTTEPAAPLTEEERLLQEYGFKQAFKPDGREHYIPRSKVLSMIASGLKRGTEKWSTERATIEAQAKTYESQLAQLRQQVQGDPTAFLRELSAVDPRYAAFLQAQTAPPKAEPAPPAEMPPPDLALPDGSKTYSIDGLRKLLDWNAAQVEARMEAKLKPVQELEAARRAELDRQRTVQELRSHVEAVITDAKTWPGFAEHEPAILKALQDDSATAQAAGRRPTLTLEGAYRQVVMKKLLEDDVTKRAQILKDMQAAPAAPALGRTPTDAAVGGGPRTTADIAARTLARLEKAGS